jgi:hypothetical protein
VRFAPRSRGREEGNVVQPVHREVHFWRSGLTQPPCEPLEDGFEWSDAVEDVTCEGCLEALAGDAGDLGRREGDRTPGRDADHPAP